MKYYKVDLYNEARLNFESYYLCKSGDTFYWIFSRLFKSFINPTDKGFKKIIDYCLDTGKEYKVYVEKTKHVLSYSVEEISLEHFLSLFDIQIPLLLTSPSHELRAWVRLYLKSK